MGEPDIDDGTVAGNAVETAVRLALSRASASGVFKSSDKAATIPLSGSDGSASPAARMVTAAPAGRAGGRIRLSGAGRDGGGEWPAAN